MLRINDSLVSIITPCYNSELTIASTIESVLSQTYQDWELIIIDDCSTDNTAEIIKEYKDPRINYLKTEFRSGTPVHPRNIGIKKALGRYIAFLDSDDIWYPTKLETQIPIFEDNNVAIVYSNYDKIDNNGSSKKRRITASSMHCYKTLLMGNEIACLTCIVDRKKSENILFESIGHEDYFLWLSILKKGYIAKNSNESLAAYRVSRNSLSSNKLKAACWVWNILRKQELPILITIFYFFSCALKSFIKYIK